MELALRDEKELNMRQEIRTLKQRAASFHAQLVAAKVATYTLCKSACVRMPGVRNIPDYGGFCLALRRNHCQHVSAEAALCLMAGEDFRGSVSHHKVLARCETRAAVVARLNFGARRAELDDSMVALSASVAGDGDGADLSAGAVAP
eukprot:1314996-Pyramimonas_sp.AAC.1